MNELPCWRIACKSIEHKSIISTLSMLQNLKYRYSTAMWFGLGFIYSFISIFLFQSSQKESVPKKKRKIENPDDLNSSEEEMSESDDQGDEDDENVSFYFKICTSH